MPPDDLLKLLHGKFSCLTIDFNSDHAVNYEMADNWLDYQSDESRIEWASEDEKKRAIARNSVWTIQWYPDNPVGFNCVGASTFEAAAAFALKEQSDGS